MFVGLVSKLIDTVWVFACAELEMCCNWMECLIHGGWMFQRKSLSSFHHSSNTSLSSFIFFCHSFFVFSDFVPLITPATVPFTRPICLSFLPFPLHSLIPPPPSRWLQLAYLHVCVWAVWAPSCQNLLCVCVRMCMFQQMYQRMFALLLNQCNCVFVSRVCLSHGDRCACVGEVCQHAFVLRLCAGVCLLIQCVAACLCVSVYASSLSPVCQA